LALPLCNILNNIIVKREYLNFFIRLIELSKRDHADVNIKDLGIKNGLTILDTLLQDNSQSRQRVALYKWKRVIDSARQPVIQRPRVDIDQRKEKIRLYKLKKVMNHLSINRLNEAFQDIVEFVENKMAVPVEEVPEIQQQVEEEEKFVRDEVPSNKKILLDFVKNQTMINAKLEQSYKKKTAESLMVIRRYQQISALETLLYKDQQRAQHNTQVLQRCFKKWEYKISFTHGMTTEYNNLLRILEGESNVINSEIQQIDQIRLEKAAVYLNFLEEVNSDLIEIIELHEKELEGPAAQEVFLQSELKRNRTLSM